jgi:ABC-2 type transport system ATP-binding protein
MLKLTNLTKKYGNLTAVNGLNLEVEAGEVFGLLGPNGAGKTTTMKMIAGLEKPTAGTVAIGGCDIQKEPVQAKKIMAYVPDAPYLYHLLTGREFLEFVADVWQMDENQKKANIEKYLALFDLEAQADRLIDSYSQGMRQKIALASALVHEPKLLVLDEPLTGVDALVAKKIKNILVNYAGAGHAVFLSTHIMAVAEQLCTRIGIINEGRLIAVGTLEELKEKACGNENMALEDVFLHLIKEYAQE